MTSNYQLGYTLVVCEKPDVARKIAHALGNSSFKERARMTPFFSVTDHSNEAFLYVRQLVTCTD